MPVTATFSFKDSDVQRVFTFPKVCRGVRHNFKRPIRCEISWDHISLSTHERNHLKSWIYKDVFWSLASDLKERKKELIIDKDLKEELELL